MRKVILNLAVSLDGFIEGPNGEYDWCFTDQDYGLTDFFKRTDTIFYGKKSYQLFGSYSPSENASEMETGIFQMMMGMKKYVFSSTLSSAEGATVISKNFIEEVNKIKQLSGKDIYLFGGAGLITSFQNADLIDEYIIGLHPVILGAGLPLFRDIKERKKLKFVKSVSYSTGLVMLYYELEK